MLVWKTDHYLGNIDWHANLGWHGNSDWDDNIVGRHIYYKIVKVNTQGWHVYIWTQPMHFSLNHPFNPYFVQIRSKRNITKNLWVFTYGPSSHQGPCCMGVYIWTQSMHCSLNHPFKPYFVQIRSKRNITKNLWMFTSGPSSQEGLAVWRCLHFDPALQLHIPSTLKP